MKRRNPFSHGLTFYLDLREMIKLYAAKYPERIIAAMFIILLFAVAALLLSKATYKNAYAGSIRAISNKLKLPDQSSTNPGPSVGVDMMNLLGAYQQASSINPDSITPKDSLLIKEIDKDLNRILNEKN